MEARLHATKSKMFPEIRSIAQNRLSKCNQKIVLIRISPTSPLHYELILDVAVQHPKCVYVCPEYMTYPMI